MSLSIKNLNVQLQKNKILHGIDLEIQDGEFVSLLGASGCGKSTLLKSVAGLLEIESGEICVNNQCVNDKAPEKRGTIIVFQDLRLFPHMTVEKNIAFAMELKKVPKQEQKEIVDKLLSDVLLSGYGKRKIKEMSGGQLQRVALARALAANPKVLLLDEPFSGLDERLRIEMGALVKKLHQQKHLTTVLVTHDKREALQMSDRIALMSEGKILQYDTPQKIYYHPNSEIVADYFGKMNYINGKMVRPFDVQICPDKSDCVVKEIIFMGETVEVVLDTPVGEVVSTMISGEVKRLGIQVGRLCGIKVQMED